MNRFLTINHIVFVLFVSLLTNGLAWAFHGEVFMHELGHHHQHSLSATLRVDDVATKVTG